MPPREPRTKPRTWLAFERIAKGYTQEQMAERTGIALGSYRRLERGTHANPPVRWIINCAIVLDLDWQWVWQGQWNEWLVLNPDADKPATEPSEHDRELWEYDAQGWVTPSQQRLEPRPALPWAD